MSEDGKYRKQNLIGSGDRVDVFLGLNIAFDRKIAIKELRGGIETSDTERSAFYSEYEQWAKLENRRIAQIADIDRTRAWVIQEYLPDSILDLSDQLSQDMQLAYSAIEQLLEGLAFLHSKGLMHCNLKASNFRFSGGSWKLCDGRCVRIGFPGSLPKPRGSNRYLAPEMINEEFGSVGTASDIYVAGMVILETLAGDQFESLFQGFVSGTPDVEMGWVRWHNAPDRLDPIHTLLPSIPKPLADILDGMLCKEVRIRHASAERLLKELSEARDAIISAAPISESSAGRAGQSGKSNKPESHAASARGSGSSGSGSSPGSSSPVPVAEPRPKEQPVKLIDRPSSALYVRCLSGPLAGSIFPAPMGEVIIGADNQCNVRLSPEQYPAIHGRQIRISLGSTGWQISDPQGHPIIVDLKKSFDAAPIRSGSIFRITPRGPDFQFVVQGEHDWTWQDISSELKLLAPETHSVPDRLMKGTTNKPATAAAVPVQPRARPVSAAVAAPAPPPPAVSAKDQKKEKAKSRKAAVAAPVRVAPPIPAASATVGSAPAAPAPPKPAAAPAGAPSPPAAVAGAPAGSSADRTKKMDHNKRNNLILIIALPIVAVLIILFMPRSKSGTDKSGGEQGVVDQNGDQSETPVNQADETNDSTKGTSADNTADPQASKTGTDQPANAGADSANNQDKSEPPQKSN